MDTPVAPRGLRAPEDGPTYDLIALALVGLTLLFVGVWTTRQFRKPLPSVSDYEAQFGSVESLENIVEKGYPDTMTSSERLLAARWADFNLRPGTPPLIVVAFQFNLRQAVRLEASERVALQRGSSLGDRQAEIDLQANLRSPAREYARQWIARRREVTSARDERLGFQDKEHSELLDLLTVMNEKDGLGFKAEEEQERALIAAHTPEGFKSKVIPVKTAEPAK